MKNLWTGLWKDEEVDMLSKQFGIRPGCRLQLNEDYYFPEKIFLTEGYSPPGGYVKDFGIIIKNERLHLFHIDGRPGERCWATGNEISFGHASTNDYRRWIRHRMPLAVGESSWESEHIWAPYVYKRGSVYYMFYMGSGQGETFISYATSFDLQSWERWEQGPIRAAVGRDPFVFDYEDKAILLYTGHNGAQVSACMTQDMISWEAISDIISIPNGVAAESCSLHSFDDRYLLWFNDYQTNLDNFRAAYVFSYDPFKFDADEIIEFKFITSNPEAVPCPKLRVTKPTPLSIELIAKHDNIWFVAYFRWHVDRNRFFLGVIDWSIHPATIREISNEDELHSVQKRVGMI